MLTFAAIKTTAYTDDWCDFYCEQCAAEKWGTLFIAKLEARMIDGGDHNANGVSSVSDYGMGEIESNEQWSRAESLAEDDEDGRSIDEICESLDGEPTVQCSGSCGRWYTGGA